MGNRSDSDNGVFFDELIFLDEQFDHSNDFFDFIFPILKKNGYVKDSFLVAIKQRENEFPTALPTEPYVVALPHTDIEHIIKPFISVTRVAQTVKWCEMANNDCVLDAKFIFLLGFVEKNGHVGLLQTLMGCFSEGYLLDDLYQAKTKAEFMQLLTNNVKF